MFNKTDTHMLRLISDYQIGCYADRMAKRQTVLATKKSKASRCGREAEPCRRA